MRILLLTHSFNSLSQRLHVELNQLGHEVSVEFDINDRVAEQAVAMFQPDLIIAPFLKRAIPASIWQKHLCLIVHPGIVGDRGPSALDWAIQSASEEWGVTVLQAEAEMDAGPVWAHATFPMRAVKKSTLYRNEVTTAAVQCVRQALARVEQSDYQPQPAQSIDVEIRGDWQPSMRQSDRAIDWERDTTQTVIAKINAADGVPGVLDEIAGLPVYLHNVCAEPNQRGKPGELLGRRDGAICRATLDGAVWIGHLRARPENDRPTMKLPAVMVLGELAAALPELGVADDLAAQNSDQAVRYREASGVGYLYFDFYNGAMSTTQCQKLRDAFVSASQRDTCVLVLMGGEDFWSNGIHLNVIEAAENSADESWQNINAMNDLALAIITNGRQLTVSALRGNAGAGGVFLALAADYVWAREGVVLNPHYKSMGNLYGSEYWTYLLPKRVGPEAATSLTQNRLPVGVQQAKAAGLIDDAFGADPNAFEAELIKRCEALASSEDIDLKLPQKIAQRMADEAEKPLTAYREEELAQMKLNFYGFDSSYHVARYHFVHKWPKSRTPIYLARHRGVRRDTI